jgi:hypothetical protein
MFVYQQLILVFLLHFSVALAQTQLASITTTMAADGGNGPLAPHIRPCAPRRGAEWMGNNPLIKQV